MVSRLRLDFNPKIKIHIKFGNLSWDFSFLIASILPYDMILGCNFLRKTKATIDFKSQEIVFPYDFFLV